MSANTESHTINAESKTLGRLSTEIANLLRGKNKVDFSYNKAMGDKVIIVNPQKARFTGRKLEQKEYMRHSGYLGNLKSEKLKDLFSRIPEEVIKRAVYGMLPHNKLKKDWMKNLSFQYSENKEK